MQFEKAFEFIKQLEKSDTKGLINLAVLAEVSFLLLRTYKIPKINFITIFYAITKKSYFVLKHELAVFKALEVFKSLNADFHDLLIAFVNQDQGANTTVSIDKKAVLNLFLPTLNKIPNMSSGL